MFIKYECLNAKKKMHGCDFTGSPGSAFDLKRIAVENVFFSFYSNDTNCSKCKKKTLLQYNFGTTQYYQKEFTE